MDFSEIVNTQDWAWKDHAERLAARGIPFVLMNFSYASHVKFYDQIALEHDLESFFILSQGRAFFRPSNPKRTITPD